MRAYAHHKNGPGCPGCEDRLKDAHSDLGVWFRSRRLAQAPGEHQMHISWSFRDETTQDEAVKNGASKLSWPHSKHNNMVDGMPMSLALDIFQEDASGKAVYDPIFCARLNAASKQAGFSLRWGGDWPRLGDAGHFELI